MCEVTERCDFRIGDNIGDKYVVEKPLGEGTFGKIFKVNDKRNGQVWALKLFKFWKLSQKTREEMFPRSQMEFETGQISSKYLVHSIENGTIKGNPFIVMEFCPNGNLQQLMSSKKDVDLSKIGKEILYGLKDLHSCGKVHRDLKPENVLIKSDGVAALADFGISGDRAKRLTSIDFFGRPKEIMGTYAYMAPEQSKPKNKEVTVLPTMDIFAFGVMIYILITNDFPFGPLNDNNDLALYIRNAREGNWNRKRLSDYPEGKKFEPMISGCLIPDFKQRLQNIDTVLSLMPPSNDAHYQGHGNAVKKNIEKGVLLRIMQGEEYGAVYQLNNLIKGKSSVITMGYSDNSVNNTISIVENLSRYISRKHCTLELTGNKQWYIRDGQWDKDAPMMWKRSLNGTYINSSEVSHEGMPVNPGDIITIGDVKLRVEGY